MGRQSATSTAQTVPGCRLKAASPTSGAEGGAVRSCPSKRTTLVPCTCFSQRGSFGRNLPSAARFFSTVLGLSPTWSPRLKLAYAEGELPVPLSRVVNSAATLGGAGQSGTIQPLILIPKPHQSRFYYFDGAAKA